MFPVYALLVQYQADRAWELDVLCLRFIQCMLEAAGSMKEARGGVITGGCGK
jgi:hypothetical protein